MLKGREIGGAGFREAEELVVEGKDLEAVLERVRKGDNVEKVK